MATTTPPPTVSNYLPVGIDLGSLNARIALIPKDTTTPQTIPNTQGDRHTHAISTPESEPLNGQKTEYIFGDAANRHLIRSSSNKCPADHMVRKMSSIGSDGETENETKLREDASAAFLGHLADLACDASASKPSTLRVVVSVPNCADEETINGVLKCCDGGVKNLIGSKEGKNRKKNMGKEILVLGVLSDAAAVCVAHGLTSDERNTSPSSRVVKQCLVIDWGDSGLSLTSVTVSPNNLLSTPKTTHHSELSGQRLLHCLTEHLVNTFKQKNRGYRNENILSSKKTKFKLQTAAQSALRTLSQTNSAPIAIDGVFDGLDLNVSISRPRWEMLCSSFLRQAETKFKEMTNDGVVFDAVLMAGSVCQMPSVVAVVERVFPGVWRGNGEIPVEDAVAFGCARHAKACLEAMQATADQEKEIPMDRMGEVEVSVSPVGIGVVLLGPDDNELNEDSAQEYKCEQELMSILIDIGMPLPAHVSKVIRHSKDDTASAPWSRVGIVQYSANKEKTVIGTLDSLDGLEEVELTVQLSVDGNLTMAVNGDETVTV